MPGIFIGGCMPSQNMDTQTNYTQVGTMKIKNNSGIISIPITNMAVGSPLRIYHNDSIRCMNIVPASDASASGFRIYNDDDIYAISTSLTI